MDDKRQVSRKLKFGDTDRVVRDPGHEFVSELTKPYIKDGKLLDVGCWTGGYLTRLAESNSTSLLVGIDIEENALRVAKFGNSNLIAASVLNLPFREEVFDVVTFWTVIEHLPQGTEMNAISEISRVLKKNGWVFLSTENAHILSELLDPAFFLSGHRHYYKGYIERLLLSAGFTVEDSFVVEGLVRCLYLILLYIFKHVFNKPFPKSLYTLLDTLQKKEYSYNIGFKTLYMVGKKLGNHT